jgi:hypothetical protein
VFSKARERREKVRDRRGERKERKGEQFSDTIFSHLPNRRLTRSF